MQKEVAIFLWILLIGTVSASFSVGNLSHSIQTNYGPEADISGWINLSFEEESGGSLFEDSEENSIYLIDLLKNQTNYDYSCIPSSCKSAYSFSGEENLKIFNLNTGEERLIGIKLTGEIQGVNFNGFEIESSADASCSNQIKIDFLNDNSYEKGNNKSVEEDCGSLRDYGCYEFVKSTEEGKIGNTPYCQRIELSESPGFKIGAWIKKSGINSTIKMFLKNLYGEIVEGTTCTLPTASTSGSEIYCSINFPVTEPEEYYVCINSESETDYSIKGYDDSDGCGFYGEELEPEMASYLIFSEGKKFSAVGNLSITNALPNENTLSSLIEDYLAENYEDSDYNCASDCIAYCASGCIIPIKIKSGKNQEVQLKNLKFDYLTATKKVSSTEFYEIEESYPEINADFGKLEIDRGGFSSPESYGNSTFSLYFKDEKIFSEKISVEEVPVISSLTPTRSVSSFPTKFSAKVNSSSPITEYYWKFGDGYDGVTSISKATHIYNLTGTYNLELKVTDDKGRISSKNFVITIGNPKDVIEDILDEKNNNLNLIKTQINKYNSFYQKQFEEVLKITSLGNDLKDLERRYKSTFREEDYNKILTELLENEVPLSLEVSSKGDNLLFFPSENVINLDILKEIEQNSYQSDYEDKYKEAILEWQSQNMEVLLSFEKFSWKYDSDDVMTGTFYNFNINSLEGLGYNSYAVIKNIENFALKENYLENEKNDYTYIVLKSDGEISFFATEEINIKELPVFFSPGLDRLSIENIITATEKKPINFALMFLVLILILLIGTGIYILLQEWYKRKYETYLFRDQTNLYNLVNYIHNMKNRGFKEREIENKLIDAGWNREQTAYAIKKYAGKRTGMIELPVEKILKIFKRKEPIDSGKSLSLPPRAVMPFPIRPKIPQRFNQNTKARDREMFFKNK